MKYLEFPILIFLFLTRSPFAWAAMTCEGHYQERFRIEEQVLFKLAAQISQHQRNSGDASDLIVSKQSLEIGLRGAGENIFDLEKKLALKIPRESTRAAENSDLRSSLPMKKSLQVFGFFESQRFVLRGNTSSMIELSDGSLAVADSLKISFFAREESQFKNLPYFELPTDGSGFASYLISSVVALPNGNLAAIDPFGNLRWVRKEGDRFNWDANYLNRKGTYSAQSPIPKIAILANSDLVVLRSHGLKQLTSIEIFKQGQDREYHSFQVMKSKNRLLGLAQDKENAPGKTISAEGIFTYFMPLKEGGFIIVFKDLLMVWNVDPRTGQYFNSSQLKTSSQSSNGPIIRQIQSVAQLSEKEYLLLGAEDDERGNWNFYSIKEIENNKFDIKKLQTERPNLFATPIGDLNIFRNKDGQAMAVGYMDFYGNLNIWKFKDSNQLDLAQKQIETQKKVKEDYLNATIANSNKLSGRIFIPERKGDEVNGTLLLRDGNLLTSTLGTASFEAVLRVWSPSIEYSK